MDPQEDIAFLAGSPNRVYLLRELRERPGRGAELARRCSLPRSTVHRCLDGLATRGWVEKSNGQHRLTAPGELVLSAYEDLAETIAVSTTHREMLTQLGDIGRTLPTEAIAEASVIEATPENPYATIEHYVDVLKSGSFDRMRGIVPISARLLNDAGRPLLEANVGIEIVIDEGVLETARESHPDAHQFGLDSETLALYVHPQTLSFGLAILDAERALVGAYDEQGNPRACLDGTNDALIEWANEAYECHRQEAAPIEARPEITNSGASTR
ncbi:transcriptional regulator [Halobacteriales archaeon QS_3_64_16]|nr:MAG: transcriptional regulator [Halobacteriales archaeon QS_3_64_16]